MISSSISRVFATETAFTDPTDNGMNGNDAFQNDGTEFDYGFSDDGMPVDTGFYEDYVPVSDDGVDTVSIGG